MFLNLFAKVLAVDSCGESVVWLHSISEPAWWKQVMRPASIMVLSPRIIKTWNKQQLLENTRLSGKFVINRNTMTTVVLRKKLADYLQIADDKKIKAIYTMVKDEIDTKANDWDKDFIAELDKRSQSFQNGTAKTYSWKETKNAAIKRVKSKGK